MNYPTFDKRICVYTHTPCPSRCSGNDDACRQLAAEELKQSREVFAKAGGMNLVAEQAEAYRMQSGPVALNPWWRSVYDRVYLAIGVGSSPPKRQPPAANKCPGCSRKIPDNQISCGRPKCYDVAKHGNLGKAFIDSDRGEQVGSAIDAMHRQRGCSPFSLQAARECRAKRT